MALQGTLDIFSVDDVLRLLANTTKTGRLRIDGSDGGGNLWFVAGAMTGGDTTGRVASTAANALFELQRLAVDRFEFFPGEELADAGDPNDVESVITEAGLRLEDWLELAAVVPSLDAAVTLAPELSEDVVEIDRGRWRLLAAVGGGTSVRRIGDALTLDEFELCRSVKDLVEAHLVVLGEDVDPDVTDVRDSDGALGSRDVALDVQGVDHRYLPSGVGLGSSGEALPEPLPGESSATSIDSTTSLAASPGFPADVTFEPVTMEPGTDPFGNPRGNQTTGDENRNGRGGFH